MLHGSKSWAGDWGTRSSRGSAEGSSTSTRTRGWPSSTAISRPATSCWTRTWTPRSPTLGWPSCSALTQGRETPTALLEHSKFVAAHPATRTRFVLTWYSCRASSRIAADTWRRSTPSTASSRSNRRFQLRCPCPRDHHRPTQLNLVMVRDPGHNQTKLIMSAFKSPIHTTPLVPPPKPVHTELQCS